MGKIRYNSEHQKDLLNVSSISNLIGKPQIEKNKTESALKKARNVCDVIADFLRTPRNVCDGIADFLRTLINIFPPVRSVEL